MQAFARLDSRVNTHQDAEDGMALSRQERRQILNGQSEGVIDGKAWREYL